MKNAALWSEPRSRMQSARLSVSGHVGQSDVMRLWSREEGEHLVTPVVQETYPSLVAAEVCRFHHVAGELWRFAYEQCLEGVVGLELFPTNPLTAPLHIDEPAEGVEGRYQEVAGGGPPQPGFIPGGGDPP